MVKCPDMPTCPASSTLRSRMDLAGEAGLRADDVVLANHAGMPDLYQAVDLGAAFDPGFADGGAIHRREALHFHIVFNDGYAGLDNL